VSGLFQDNDLTNAEAEQPWKKSETDRMLDLYFVGSHPKEIAYKLQRNPKAVKRRVEQFVANERDRAVLYTPVARVSRKGHRWTENERLLLRSHVERKIPADVTARVLQRDIQEIAPKMPEDKIAVKECKILAPSMDLLLAARYSYLVYKKPVMADEEYDDLKAEEIEYGGAKHLVRHLVDPKDSPRRIKTLALYLVERKEDREKGSI